MGWDSKVSTIESLEKRVPYPSKENEEALEGDLQAYQQSVQELYESLETFQPELNKDLVNTEFQQMVKTRVEEFRPFANSKNFVIESDTEFQLGFERYAQTLPPPQLVPILDYELKAIDHLLRSLVEAGATSLTSFERDPIPGEAGAPANHESGVAHKYPVRVGFEASHEAFQTFINQLANDKQFFYIVRVLKVRNQVTEGPVKLSPAQSNFPVFEHPTTKEVVSYERLKEWGYDDTPASLPAVETKAREEGFVYASTDARVLLGQEKLNVFMVVDIVRFVSPEEVAAQDAAKQPEEGDRRRRR